MPGGGDGESEGDEVKGPGGSPVRLGGMSLAELLTSCILIVYLPVFPITEEASWKLGHSFILHLCVQ